jgi:hypothetical protein
MYAVVVVAVARSIRHTLQRALWVAALADLLLKPLTSMPVQILL